MKPIEPIESFPRDPIGLATVDGNAQVHHDVAQRLPRPQGSG